MSDRSLGSLAARAAARSSLAAARAAKNLESRALRGWLERRENGDVMLVLRAPGVDARIELRSSECAPAAAVLQLLATSLQGLAAIEE